MISIGCGTGSTGITKTLCSLLSYCVLIISGVTGASCQAHAAAGWLTGAVQPNKLISQNAEWLPLHVTRYIHARLSRAVFDHTPKPHGIPPPSPFSVHTEYIECPSNVTSAHTGVEMSPAFRVSKSIISKTPPSSPPTTVVIPSGSPATSDLSWPLGIRHRQKNSQRPEDRTTGPTTEAGWVTSTCVCFIIAELNRNRNLKKKTVVASKIANPASATYSTYFRFTCSSTNSKFARLIWFDESSR